MTTETNKEDIESLTAEQIADIIKERDEAKALADSHKGERDGVVAELIDLRKKNQELKAIVPEAPLDEVERKVQEALNKRDLQTVEEKRGSAWKKFIESNKEFAPENDIAGIKSQALEKKLARFNTNGVTSEDGFISIYEDAVRLLRNEDNSRGQNNESPFASVPSGGSATPPQPGNSFSEAERAAFTKVGWTAEKYAEMKKKHPSLINQLLNYN